MATKLFMDKDIKPDEQLLSSTPGSSYKLFCEMKDLLAIYGDFTEDWKYYGKITGWTMKYIYKKSRRITSKLRIISIIINIS